MAVSPAAAPGWQKPVETDSATATAYRLDRHGTLRTFYEHRTLDSAGVASLKWSASRWSRCPAPGLRYNTLKYHGFSFDANPDGAMVVGWPYGRDLSTAQRYVATAKPGRCFGKRRAVPARDGLSSAVGVAMGRGGTALAWWSEGDGTRSLAFATGAAGQRLVRRGVVLRARGSGVGYDGGLPTFGEDDRVQWSWLTTEAPFGVDDPRRRQHLWFTRGGRHGGAVPAPHVTYSRTTKRYADLAYNMNYLRTDARGGQVTWGVGAPSGHFALLERDPGEHFTNRVRAGRSFTPDASAGNPAGDVVFAGHVGDDVYALYRRRNGSVAGPVNLSPGPPPRVDGRPVVGIDDAGRAVVAWQTGYNASLYEGCEPYDIRAVTIDANGRFAKQRVISGADRQDDESPSVAVNPQGRVAVAWTRVKGCGNDETFHAVVARGRTER